jgi:DNA invertase Pin-like site-specific DNA recombinase
MDAVAYVRVSSKAQGLVMQKAAIEKAASARGDKIVRWYSDKLSGGTMTRPGLEKLRAEARAGELARLYVYRLDRLTRSGIRDTLDVVEELRSHGCTIATVADGFDLAGPAAEVVLAVLSWAAKMERLAIGERIASARARVEAEGGRWGRPRRMDDAQVARAAALRRKGLSVRQVASQLGLPKSTVERAVRP